MVVTLPRYRKITKDMTSYDGDVSAALIEAQQGFEEFTGRHLELDERTETLKVYPNWLVYPSAIPVVSVSSPASAVIRDLYALSVFYTDQLVNNSYDNVVSQYTSIEAQFRPPYQRTVAVTYTGGYDEGEMPAGITRLIADIAAYNLSTQAVAVPSGATSVHSGRVRIDFAKGFDNGIPARLVKRLNHYKLHSV